MGLSIFDEVITVSSMQSIVPADTTTKKTLQTTVSGRGGRLDNILLTNTDGIDHKVDFFWYDGSLNHSIGSVDVPAGTGVGGLVAVDAIPLLVAAGQAGLFLNSSAVYHWSVEVTVVTGEVVALLQGGYF